MCPTLCVHYKDKYYRGLVSVVNQVLKYIELRRYSFRQKTGKGRKSHLFSEQLNILTDYTAVKDKVLTVMKDANVEPKKVEELNTFIDKDIDNKIKVAKNIEKQIAMYQGQATLGKIMDVVMHEVKKPLGWVRNQTKTLTKAYYRYLDSGNEKDLEKILRIVQETPEHLSVISDLFKRLNSLATRNRSAMRDMNLVEVIGTTIAIFQDEIKMKEIEIVWEPEKDIIFNGWKEDIVAAFANILENAIYWVSFQTENKIIEITLIENETYCTVGFYNNGPSIIKELLDSNTLFTPGISGKVTDDGAGTGLGLSIAGEAIERNGGKIKVIDIKTGAKFLVKLPIAKE